MAFSGGFAVRVGARAILMGALAFAAAYAASRNLYATSLVLAGAAALVGLDVARSAGAADRMLAQFVDGLTAEGHERPTSAPGVSQLAAAIERALDRLGQARAERQQRMDLLQALVDNVAAALLVVDGAGVVVLANRAAHLRLGDVLGPLGGLPSLGRATTERLLALAPGAQEIVRTTEGRSLLAQAAAFQAPGAGARRLISLHSVSGDLDAVEVKAWQDLVRVLAHEMMNSLTPICSLSESLVERLREGEREAAEAMEVIARRSAGLMSFVERYRRVADLPPTAKSAVAVHDLVARLDRLMGPMMAEAGVAYSSRLATAKLTLNADADLLEQALINLVKNALDAVRGQDGGAVTVSGGLDGDVLVIEVEDNGPGLAMDDAETVFVPFYTTKAGGSGVGLTLARQIALAHGGRLDHRRAAPHGAVFRMVLPLR